MSDLPFPAASAEPGDDDPEPAVWGEARRAFGAGDSLPMVAERFGLNLRTVQRRAASQGWRGDGAAAWPGLPGRRVRPGPDEALAEDPHLAPFAEAHAFEVGQLLMETTPDLLARYALRKAGEAAAGDRPVAAGAWLRGINGVLRAGPKLDRLRLPFSEADHMRALYAAALRGEGPSPVTGPAGPATAVMSPVVSPRSQGGDTTGLHGAARDTPLQKSRSS